MTLKFEPEEKLKCLFKKYMDLGPNRPQQKSPDKNLTDEEWNAPDAYHISDFVNPESEEFNDAFDCQMENFGWIKFKDDWIFNDGCYTNPFKKKPENYCKKCGGKGNLTHDDGSFREWCDKCGGTGIEKVK
jgi:hypothetical protein